MLKQLCDTGPWIQVETFLFTLFVVQYITYNRMGVIICYIISSLVGRIPVFAKHNFSVLSKCLCANGRRYALTSSKTKTSIKNNRGFIKYYERFNDVGYVFNDIFLLKWYPSVRIFSRQICTSIKFSILDLHLETKQKQKQTNKQTDKQKSIQINLSFCFCLHQQRNCFLQELPLQDFSVA